MSGDGKRDERVPGLQIVTDKGNGVLADTKPLGHDIGIELNQAKRSTAESERLRLDATALLMKLYRSMIMTRQYHVGSMMFVSNARRYDDYK